MPPMRMVHEADPASELLKKAGSLDEIVLLGDQILLGVYKRPEKTASGLYLSDKTRDEDEHQGKAGLVLKVGPGCFKYDGDYAYEGPQPKVGDWVACWVTDGRKVNINGVLCRVVRSDQVRMIIPAPDVVY